MAKEKKIVFELALVLSDDLAREAEANGLLTSQSLEALLRAELRRRRVEDLFAAADRLAALSLPPLTQAEVAAEIEAVRNQQHL